MFLSRFQAQVAVAFVLVMRANAESHTIKFVNNCGKGTPQLMYDGKNILQGDTYTTDTSYSGIAYLQTGQCGANGEMCTLLETTINNPTCAGCGSSTDISLIPPHALNVPTSFAYYNGCDGAGKMCDNPTCTDDAFFVPTDWVAQVACELNNVNLLVAFCANASQIVLDGGVSAAGGGSSPTSSLPTSSLPSSSQPSPSSAPGLPSSGGSVPPATSPASSTPSKTHTHTPTPTNTDGGSSQCSVPGSGTPPTDTPSHQPASASASAPSISPGGPDKSAPGPTHSHTPHSTPTSSAPLHPVKSGDPEPSAPASKPSKTPKSESTAPVDPKSSPVRSTPGNLAPASPTAPDQCHPHTTGLTPSNSAHRSHTKVPSTTHTHTHVPSTTPTTASPRRRHHRRTNRFGN